jgi:hypothetical protein
MHLDSRLKAAAGTAAAVGLIAALAAGGPAAASPGAQGSAACVPSRNVEAIIDDSGSMSGSDPSNFRAKLMAAYIGLNDGKTLGAVKFSDTASQLFAPAVITAASAPAMNDAFTTKLVNSGGTNYDVGFTLGNTDNPTATSRIFLSDGAPTTDNNLQRTPPTTTYVVGLGVGTNTSAVKELTEIATDTGGPTPLFVEDAAQLQAAAGAITAGQNCKQLTTFTDSFSSQGQQFGHAFKAVGKSADILTTWPVIGTSLDIVKVTQPGTGGPQGANPRLASSAKVKTTKKKGTTFTTIHLKGLKKGKKVKFKVKATALAGPTTGTTQVIR